MKGFKHITKNDSKKELVERLIFKSLPYGMWTTESDELFLFNRDYEPIKGWNIKSKEVIPVYHSMWIRGIVKQEYYYNQDNCPIKNINTFRNCWDILADWTARENE